LSNKAALIAYNANYIRKYGGQRLAIGHTQIGQVKMDLDQQFVYHNFWYKLPEPSQEASASPSPITQHMLYVAPG